MKALILSGGGALGAFQVGAEKYAREVKGYRWDLIAGVSVGALNGAMLAQGKDQRLYEIWSAEISNRRLYGPLGRKLTSVLWVCGALVRFHLPRSLYPLKPIRRLVQRELGQGTFQVPLKVGTVSLITGKYEPFTDKHPNILEAVVASSCMPIARPLVNVGPDFPWMTDGGVRNTSPIGDVLADVLAADPEDPGELVIINCLPTDLAPLEKLPKSLVGVAMRSFDLLLNEIFQDDLKEFLSINALVKEAEDSRIVLHHPGNPLTEIEEGNAPATPNRPRRRLRYVPYRLIQPQTSLGDAQDFSGEQALRLLDAGRRMAQKVLG